ncbi:MAG: primosomal protein N' [Candidatus Aminicenantales bacterium]
MTLYAEVVFPLPLTRSFLYTIPPSLQGRAQTGTRVFAPLGNKTLMGFIVRIHRRKTDKIVAFKDIRNVIDESPVFTAPFLSFTQKLSGHYFASWGEFLEAALPPSLALKTKHRISLSEKGKEALRAGRLSGEEKKLAEILGGKSYSVFFLRRKYHLKSLSSLLSRMEKKEFVSFTGEVTKARPQREIRLPRPEVQLEFEFAPDAETQRSIEIVQEKIRASGFAPFYLFGPQNDRLAFYFFLIPKVFSLSKRVLFLVPEISFTRTLQEQIEKKLGKRAAFIHSRLSEAARETEWRRIMNRQVDVVVGPRSALFSPVENLGLVVLEEEQEESYFQPESPSYDARQGAWLRAVEQEAVLVYGSGTPTVEALYRAQKDGYLLTLNKGESRKEKKRVSIVDVRMEDGGLSRRLNEEIRKRLLARKRIIIFLNRRGYASFLYCPKCGSIPKCQRCDISLAYHKREGKLICHYCRFSIPRLTSCPKCGNRVVEPRGAGVEAVEEELKRTFPKARVACFDSDITGGKKAREQILQDFEKRKIHILIGTELLAHRAGLPRASFIGILNPETRLAFPDFRSGQKTFQTINRMMGFLEDDPQAETLIQTALPDHFIIRAASRQDYPAFFEQEIQFRRLMDYPPFSLMAEVIFQGQNLRNLAQRVRTVLEDLRKRCPEVEIMGPALASISKLRGEHRIQVILRSHRKKKLDEFLAGLLGAVNVKKSVIRYD